MTTSCWLRVELHIAHQLVLCIKCCRVYFRILNPGPRMSIGGPGPQPRQSLILNPDITNALLRYANPIIPKLCIRNAPHCKQGRGTWTFASAKASRAGRAPNAMAVSAWRALGFQVNVLDVVFAFGVGELSWKGWDH